MSKKKQKIGVVFSTNPDFDFSFEEDAAQDTLPPAEQQLRVFIEKKGRKGKPVCIVAGFVGTDDDLKSLAKSLKTHCGTGGSVKDGEVILQGTMRDKIIAYLNKEGYQAR